MSAQIDDSKDSALRVTSLFTCYNNHRYKNNTNVTLQRYDTANCEETAVQHAAYNAREKNSDAPSSTIDLYITVYATGSKAKIKINALTVEIR